MNAVANVSSLWISVLMNNKKELNKRRFFDTISKIQKTHAIYIIARCNVRIQ